MTDDQISEAIEQRVLGYIVAGPYVADKHGNFVRMLDDPRPNYCDDLAAWAGLWDQLVADGWNVTVIEDAKLVTASLRHTATQRGGHINERSKGRALALATLRAHGITVEAA